jgi:hypothetical protein
MGDEALHPIVSPPLKREALKTAAFDPRPLVHMLARGPLLRVSIVLPLRYFKCFARTGSAADHTRPQTLN